MATSSIGAAAPDSTATAPGTPYIALSPAMQAFYSTRGMWAAGKPAGALAGWLADRVPDLSSVAPLRYWTTAEGLQRMADDAAGVPTAAWSTYHQRAQFLRRLREAGQRAGLARAVLPLPSAPAAGAAGAVPFRPLVVPAGGVARQAFMRHMGDTLRELIDFSQSSAWTDSEDAA